MDTNEEGHREQVVFEDPERRELLRAGEGGAAVIRVQGLTSAGKERVHDQLQLLAALEVDGVRAVPAVLDVEDDGYVREGAVALRGGTGRRSAASNNPGTQERLATARARQDLDELIDALHECGWVLGAPMGEGLAVRADGTATVRDLSGLRPDTSLALRLEDRLWVDSVLRDQARTLRRRIDGTGPRDLDDPHFAPMPAARLPEPARASSLPAPRGLRKRQRSPGRTTRRWLAITAVVLAGTGLGVTVWLLDPLGAQPMDDDGAAPSSEQGPSGAPEPANAEPQPGEEVEPAVEFGTVPVIDDPQALAERIAQNRYAYVTGASENPAAMPGSPAETADENVRSAYEDVEVRGGQPEMTEMFISIEPTADGHAQLQGWTSTAAHELVLADGSIHSVPASPPQLVQLDLVWDGSTWRVQQTTLL